MSGSHIVQSGETLSGIAAKYDLQLADLVKWNNLDNPDLIQVGQEIELSGHEAPPADETYVVQPGDTVSGIAEKFGKTWLDIAVYNKLENMDLIYAGQSLIIPTQGVAR